MKKIYVPGLILGLIITIFMHLLPIVPIVPIRRGDTWTGWKRLSERMILLKNEMGEDSTFIFSHEYKLPSEITFYTPNHVQTHAAEILGGKGLQYTYWTNIDELLGKNAIFVTSDAQRYKNIEKLEQFFDRIEIEKPIEIIHYNRVFRIFYIYRCYNYKGPHA